ncbi:MAG: MFS transporter [Myxococcota bacterium]
MSSPSSLERASAEASEPPAETQRRSRVSPGVWTFTTYFAEGFPYNIVHKLAEILFADLGASLTAIGLTSLFHLPLNLKFLWASWADQYGTKRTWLLGSELALAAAVAAIAIASGAGSLTTLSILFVVASLLMATHDISIDGYYLEALDKRQQARWVGLKAPSYRAALLIVGGPLVSAVGLIGWPAGFAMCSAGLVVLALLHTLILPPVAQQERTFMEFWFGRPGAVVAVVFTGLGVLLSASTSAESALALPKWFNIRIASLVLLGVLLTGGLAGARLAYDRLQESNSAFARGFVAFMGQPRVGSIIAFMLTFRLGESFLEKMRYVFLAQHGMTKEFYGVAQGTVGLTAALVAPLVGGWLISRDGLRRWIWPFVLAQNALNLLYFGLAHVAEQGPVSLTTMGVVIVVEMFGAGLGTAVFMVYIMRCCMDAHRAAHMALLTSMMSVGWTLAGTVSGVLAETLGFPAYFLLTFFATLPGMLLIFGLPNLDEEP